MAAQAQQEGLVNVDLSNLRADIAKDINVNVSQIPVNAQVPVGIAANVCGVDAMSSRGRARAARPPARPRTNRRR